MQEYNLSNEKGQTVSNSSVSELKPYQKPTLFKIEDELTGVEGGACNIAESSCGVLS